MHPRSIRLATGLVAFIFVGGPAHAQTQPPVNPGRIEELARQAVPRIELTLDDATMRALERNIDIAVERMNPQLQDLTLARLRSVYMPTASSTVFQRSQVQPPTSQLNGGALVTNNVSTYNAGLNQSVPWGGGNLGVAFNNQKLVTNSTFSNFNPTYNSNLTLTYTQPLMRGFTIDSNRQQLKVTAINRDISETQLKGTIATTLAAVRNAYWELVYATGALDVAKSSLDLARSLVDDNEARVQAGAIAPIDVVQSQAEAASRQQAVVQAQGVVRADELALKRLIVSGTEDPMWRATLVPVDRPTFSATPIDVDAALKTAMTERTDLDAARKALEGNDVTLRFLRNQKLPEVDVVGMYQTQGLGGTEFVRPGLGSTTVEQIIPGGYGDALSTLFNRAYPIWQAQVNITYPIGGSQADANYARGQVQRNQAAAQLRGLELQIATDVTNAAQQVDSSLQSYEAAQTARELAEQQLQAEQSRFEVGLTTNYQVVLSQRDLAAARNTELRALLDYRHALVSYELVQVAPAAPSPNITTVSPVATVVGASGAIVGGF